MRGKDQIQIPVSTSGLVANLPAQQVPPTAMLSSSSNVLVDVDGLLKPRKGYTPLGTMAVSDQVMGIISYLDYNGSYQTILGGQTTWQLATSTPFTNITGTADTGTADNHVQFTVLPGSSVWVYGVNNANPIQAWHVGLASYTQITSANAPATCLDLLTLGGRLVAFNTLEGGTRFYYRIRWSAINDGTTWPALSFLDLLDTGEEIVAACLSSRTSAIVYTTTNAYYLYEVPGNDANAFAAERIPTSYNISGPAGPSIICLAEGQQYYMGLDLRIWVFDGTTVHPISDAVDPILQGIVDPSNVRRGHAVYDATRRVVWIFFPTFDDNGTPKHAIGYDLRQQCFTAIMRFNDPITASANAVATIGPTWATWLTPSDTWLTIPYATWADIPVANELQIIVGTNTQAMIFDSGLADNGVFMPYSWTSPLFSEGPDKSINATDIELYISPSGLSGETITATLQGALEPYSPPTSIFSFTFDANSIPTTQTLAPTATQAQPESVRYPYMQLTLSSNGASGAGLRFAGGTLWVNEKLRGQYGTE